MALGLENGVAVALVAEGLGSAIGTDVFVGEEPPTPDDSITVLESPGGRSEQAITETHIITIRVRNLDYETGKSLLQDIHQFLVPFGNQRQGALFGSIAVMFVKSTAPGVPGGRDDHSSGGRWRFSQSFEMITKQNLAYA